MRYLALASDYDGTLAHDGVVDESTIRAVERLLQSGRSLILVTGRELADLQSVFPRLDLCARVVAENGAVLYNPATREKRVLAARPPESFVENLRNRGVQGISFGDVIVATWHPYETQVIEAIRDSGLGLQIVFNKEAVMVLPSGVNKMTGLAVALEELKLSRHNLTGIGDAENDHAFLESCECSVAVANAIPSLKDRADFVTRGERGAGVVELIDLLIGSDLSGLASRIRGVSMLIGKAGNEPVTLSRYGSNVLLCGQSGSGKSTLVAGLLERIMEQGYQLCLIDPEGDYENLPGATTIGEGKQAPTMKQVKQALGDPAAQVVVNLVGVSTADRPNLFASLIAEIQELRIRTGRPHWLVVDEAHHVLPSDWAPSSPELADQLSNLVLITVHPGHVSTAALAKVNTVIVMGRGPRTLIEEFARAVAVAAPDAPTRDLAPGRALIWFRNDNHIVPDVQASVGRSEHRRHRRKYAEGELEPDRSFYFRGPAGELNLRAQNLNIFVQLAEGVDQKTWLYHLKRHDYSSWLRSALSDTELADQIETIESDDNLQDGDSRKLVKELILDKYTAPA
jgi:HAD superfamily hydrolase (TIGR01484 family)